MKHSLIITLFLFLFVQISLAQEKPDTNYYYNRAISIGVGDLGYTLAYTSFYKKNRAIAFETVYRLGEDYTTMVFITFKDPFWCYNQFTIRGGVRFYSKQGLYFSPMGLAVYGYFNDIKFSEYEGKKNYYPLISRDKKGVGYLVKFGYTPKLGNFIFDGYIGLGCKVSNINEKIFDPDYNTTSQSNYWKEELTLHVGILFGIILK